MDKQGGEGRVEDVGPALHEFAGADQAPQFYADAINVITNLYGTAIHFGTRGAPEVGSPSRMLGVLRLSPPMAKVLAAILVQQVRLYEAEVGNIHVPEETRVRIGIEHELELLKAEEPRG